MEQANWSDHGHTDQEHLTTKNPTISSCQSRPTLSPGQVAHEGPSSWEVFSYHGGTQCNGDHCFLREEECPKWIMVATCLFHLEPHHCFFQFLTSLNCSTIYYFW